MESVEIFGLHRIHCFYKNSSDFYVLPGCTVAPDIARTRPPNNNAVGESPVYKNTEKYKPELDAQQFILMRNKWVEGKIVPQEDVLQPQFMPEEKKAITDPTKKIAIARLVKLASRVKSVQARMALATSRELRNELRMVYDRRQVELSSVCDSIEREFGQDFLHILMETNQQLTAKYASNVNIRDILSTDINGINYIAPGADAPGALAVESDDDQPSNSIPATAMHEQITDTAVFATLATIRWRDADEQAMRYESLSIPRSACANIFPKMQIMAEQLRAAIGLKTGVVENMDESDRNNFLFHVIAKGPEIYNASLNDPDFCLYLTNNWQPLYSFMQRKLNA